MKLAIVIPYYKISFFEETIASLANQTCLDFCVYIGDDCSPNDPSEIINKYAKKLKITYSKFNKNLGGEDLTKQWGRCIDLVKEEEWIMLLGDDDCLQENLIESWYNHFEMFNEQTYLVRFASQLISNSGESLSKTFKHPVWESASTSLLRKVSKESRSSLSEYIFSKEKYLKYNFHNYPLGWHSDDRAWLEFSSHKPIYTINESTVFIRVSNQSISGNFKLWGQKVKSRKYFFKYLFSEKLVEFSFSQRLYLLRYFENFVRREKILNPNIFSELLYNYIVYTKPKEVFKFLKRTFKG